MPNLNISFPKKLLALIPAQNRSKYFQNLVIKEFGLDQYTLDPIDLAKPAEIPQAKRCALDDWPTDDD